MKLLLAVALAAATMSTAATAQVPPGHDTVPAFQAGPQHDGDLSRLSADPPLALRWRRDLQGAVAYPVVAGGIAYAAVAEVVTDGGRSVSLYAVDLLTGRDVWGPVQIAGESYSASLAYDSGTVVVTTYEGLVRGYDAANGTLRWTHEPPHHTYCCGAVDILDLVTTRDGVAYVSASVNGVYRLIALDVLTGTPRWSVPAGPGTPVVGAGVVYVAGTCTAAEARSTVDGSLLWSRPPGVADSCGVAGGGMTSALHDGRLYVRATPWLEHWYSAPGAVLDALTGTELRALPPNAELPAFGGSTGYHVEDRSLVARDETTGGEVWRHASRTLVGSPLVVGEHVVVASELGTVHLVDRATGGLVWSGDAGGRFESTTGPSMYRMVPGLAFGDGVLLTAASSVLSAWESAASPVAPPPPVTERPGSATPGPLLPTESTAYQLGPRHDGHQPLDGIAAPLVPAWRHDFGGDTSFPVVADGRVFVGHCPNIHPGECEVEARDAATGAPLWGPVTTPPLGRYPYLAYGRGTLVVAAGDRVRAYDAASGELRWETPTGPYDTHMPVHGDPVVDGGRVIVDSDDGLRALDLATGRVLWGASGTGFGLRGAPAADGGQVFADAYHGMQALDAATGTQLWHGTNDEYHVQTHVVSGERLYYGDGTADRPLVFDRRDGTILGEYESVAPPVVGVGRLYLRQADRVAAFEGDRPVWVRSTPGGYAGPPLLANGQLFLRTRDAVEVLESATGRLVWRTPLDRRFSWGRYFDDSRRSMALASGRLFVPVGSTLYVFADPRLPAKGPLAPTSLAASQAQVSVDAGASATLLGRLRRPDGTAVPGRPVELWAAKDGSPSYQRISVLNTDARGEAWFRPAPSVTTRYALRHPSGGGFASSGGRSLRVAVRYVTAVTAAATAPSGTRLAVRVAARPGRAGAVVLVERWSGTTWVRLSYARTGTGGAVTVRLGIRPGTNRYRVRTLGDRGLISSTPRELSIRGR